MQTASLKSSRLDGVHRTSTSESEEIMDPVFAERRYGREDILALLRKDMKPPDGLDQCPFYLEKPQTPIILSGLNDTEQVKSILKFLELFSSQFVASATKYQLKQGAKCGESRRMAEQREQRAARQSAASKSMDIDT